MVIATWGMSRISGYRQVGRREWRVWKGERVSVAACKANRFGLQTTPLFDQRSLQIRKSPGSRSVRMGQRSIANGLQAARRANAPCKQPSQTFMLQAKGRLIFSWRDTSWFKPQYPEMYHRHKRSFNLETTWREDTQACQALLCQALLHSHCVLARGPVCKPFAPECWLIRMECWPASVRIRT
jgi:hypothetical protein